MTWTEFKRKWVRYSDKEASAYQELPTPPAHPTLRSSGARFARWNAMHRKEACQKKKYATCTCCEIENVLLLTDFGCFFRVSASGR